MKIFPILLLLFAFSAILYAQNPLFQVKDTPSEIIDTVYAELSLQGSIGFEIETNYYMGGVAPYGEHSFYVGDSGGSTDTASNVNCAERSYISFPIENIAEGYQIQSVVLNLYQSYSCGNGYSYTFPIWYDGQYYPCLVARVDYGNSLEITDFNPLTRSYIGIVSEDGSQGMRQLDITNAYRTDKSNGRQYCQLMFYFAILSDYDLMWDHISFDNMYTEFPERKPKLIIHYVNTTANEDNYNNPVPALTVYPNPIINTATVQAKTGANLLSLEVYNAKGQRIEGISRHEISKSEQVLTFDRSKLPAGLYFIRSTISEQGKTYTTSRKVMLY